MIVCVEERLWQQLEMLRIMRSSVSLIPLLTTILLPIKIARPSLADKDKASTADYA